MPKVELKYNLREQVRTMKSAKLKIESVDVSKTRWPHPKQSHQIGGSEAYDTNMVMENNPSLSNKEFSKMENTGNPNKIPNSEDHSHGSNASTGGEAVSNSSLKSTVNMPTVTKAISYSESDSNDTTKQNNTYIVHRLGESNILPSDGKSTRLGNFDIDFKKTHNNNNNTYNDIISSLFNTIGKEENASIEVEERYVNTDNVDFRKTKQHLNEYFNKTSEINIKSDNTSEYNSSTRETNTIAPASIK